MNFFGLFKRGGSAPVARDRLQILLAYERTGRGFPDLLFVLREELLATIKRHVEIDPEGITVQMERGDKVSTLELEIEIPNNVRAAPSGGRKKRAPLPAPRPV
jgi:cell division topological specificity factor